LLMPTGEVAGPHGAQDFEAWKPPEIVGVPFPQVGVLRCLADERVTPDRFAEMGNHSCDGEGATEPVIQSRFPHASLLVFVATLPRGFAGASAVSGKNVTLPATADSPSRICWAR